MGLTLLVAGAVLLCCATGGALRCRVCEVGNPYKGCLWGQGTCTAQPGGVCWTHVVDFGPLFSLSTLGCAPHGAPCDAADLVDPFFGFTYNHTCCNSTDLCNAPPALRGPWPWSRAPHTPHASLLLALALWVLR
ncbi:lymphocyte antigen 6 complex locus protein G6c-like [Emydura macquarii macquarii]|uniref:lymphocyte antigen 6 complex locus protein G6c-like n=1 Tax=Emydura macquarii macquarii TaxID=1129001 RepID=UPI00352BC790